MPKTSNTVVRSEVLVNGVAIPATRWSVEVNAYSIASSLEATISTAPAKGYPALPDYFALAQQVRPLPFAFRLGFSPSASTTPQMLSLEQGFVDETERDHDPTVREVTFTGRGTASIFQDIQITEPLLKNQAGSAIVASLFAKTAASYGIALPITTTASPQYSGKTNNTQTFDQTMRGRTLWDVMQAISVDDGYRLTVHNGMGTYGPYGLGDPALEYNWGRASNGIGITALTIKHSPRRSHNIQVVVHSYLPRSGRSISASYGHANATEGETFQIPVRAGLTHAQLQQKAQAVYNDIAKREMLVTMTVVPDATLLQTVSQNGSNFSIKLGGDIWPSTALTYEVRQCRFEFAPGGGGLPLLAHLVAGNVNPVQAGGFLT